MITFRVLGPVEASREGRLLQLGARKQRTLLAILLLNANEVVSTDRLIEALWGEAPPDTAAKVLQGYVSTLRKLLEPEREPGDPGRVLVTKPPGYMAAVDAEQLDLTLFHRLAGEGRDALASGEPEQAARLLGEALSLWRGPALADVAYEPSAQAEASRLEELRLAALEDRLAADLACGRHAQVVGELEGLIAAQPLRERLRAQLMLALYRCGRQAEALATYRAGRQMLVEELGVEPARELQDLHAAILRQDRSLDLAPGGSGGGASPAAAPPATPAPSGPDAGPLVGRDRELREFETVLESAIEGSGIVHLIGGEPGIGKSRLADELAKTARGRGARVLWGRCWEAGGAPAYWPWVQALRAHIDELDTEALRARLGRRAPEMAQLLPELRERFPDLPVPPSPESEGARFRLFDATTEFIKRSAADRPLVLVLDDIHAADTPSLLMLRYLAGEIADAAVLVIGTYRDVEVRPGHPLDATLNELGRRQAARIIRLEGLDEAHVSTLIAAGARVAPSRRAVSAIHRGTGGNPLFVEELVQLLVTENRLEDAVGDTVVRVGIPRGVHEVIGRRLERVSDECRRTLGVGAVLGREFHLEGLAEVTRRPAGELLDVLDEAVSERVIVEVAGMPDRLRFSHVLIRDVIYEELGASRRRRLHHRAGEALEALHASDLEPHLPELAHHFFEAGITGDPAKALDYARRAGDRAVGQLAFEESARLYELALRVLRTALRADEATRCDLLLALAESQLRAGDEEDAKRTFLEAADIARRLGNAEALGRAALGYGGLMVWVAARNDPRLIPLLEEALGLLPDSDSALRARLMARLSCAVRDQPDRHRRLALSEEAVAMARRIAEPRTLAYALDAHCLSVTDPQSMSRLAETASEVMRLADEIGEHERAFTGNLYLLCSLFQAADVDGAKRRLSMVTQRGESLQAPTYRWASVEFAAALALFEGRFDAAQELIPRAYAIGRHAQRFNAAAAYHLQRFLLHRERGGLERCEDDLRRSAERTPTYHILRSALADLYCQLDQPDRARSTFEDLVANHFEQVHDDEEFLASMTLLAEVSVALGDVERAEAIYELLLPHAERNAFGMIEFALGSVARPLGVLASILGRLEEAVGHLEMAIAMNLGMGARPWAAHARLDLARTLAALGTPAAVTRAGALLAEAVEEFRALGMEPWRRRAERALSGLGTAIR